MPVDYPEPARTAEVRLEARRSVAAGDAVSTGALSPVATDALPQIPVGMDAYRRWDLWPRQRIGVRAYMRSTYDRAGRNEGVDASHFLYQLAPDHYVSLDVEGKGILYFVRTNHWHGSPWRYTVDGREHIVQETSTATPDRPVANSVFLPEHLFPNPLTWTWSVTKGADLNWVPIPFEKSMRLGYSRTHYGTGYYIYHLFSDESNLSRPIQGWDGTKAPDADVLDLLKRAGTDIVPKPGTAGGDRLGIQETAGNLSLTTASQSVGVADLSGPGVIRALELSIPRDSATSFSRVRLKATWDGRTTASIDCPVGLFFGAGILYNRDDREFLVKGLPMVVRYGADRVFLSCYYPMPFFQSAKLELEGTTETVFQDVRWSIRHTPLTEPRNHVGYFHATYRDFPSPEPGHDLTVLDTKTAEGGGDWSGSFVGMSWIFSHNANLGTLEGDPRFFFDDSLSPQCYGTGTEEWGGGGDYWGGRNMTLPLAGHPAGAPSLKDARSPEDKIESAYRFLLADLMPFGRNARICLEHGSVNESREHYESVAYWYGYPAASLIRTDELKIGDSESEARHGYHSPTATAPYSITSRYEWGPDTLGGKEVYPATTDVGRTTTGTSEFTMRLVPENRGVLLRRKLDYSFPNQRAVVSVARVNGGSSDAEKSDWKTAGVWYLAGSNTCIYSNPKGELDPGQLNVQTSNRRFREDEFLIPRQLTEGADSLRIRIDFTPVERPLYPGAPLPPLAWSEMRYDAYCYVLPQ